MASKIEPIDEAPAAARDGEQAVRAFYERAPYPDLGVRPKKPTVWLDPLLKHLGAARAADALRYLDAGCGTGHVAVGVAKEMPHWQIHGIDLSSASLGVATELADKHQVSITFTRGSYLDPLPFQEPFDVIASFGSIHHTADPAGAIRNLLAHLAPDGFFVMHLYGKNLDAGKFVIREILDTLEPDLEQVDRRFALYRDLIAKQRPAMRDRLLDLSPRTLLKPIRDAFRARWRQASGESWSPSWRAAYHQPTAPWIDHFCHPLERSYDVSDVKTLTEAAGLDVLEMLGLGREDSSRLPRGWDKHWPALDRWSRWRLMELLDSTARSVLLIGRKPG